MLRVYPVCRPVVAEEGAGLTLLHLAVPVDDVVQSVLHPVCKGRGAQVLLVAPQLKVYSGEVLGSDADSTPETGLRPQTTPCMCMRGGLHLHSLCPLTLSLFFQR